MSASKSAFTTGLESLLRSHANPEKARPMTAYMKDQFPFLGIKSPERVALVKQYLLEREAPKGKELEMVVRELWALPEREFQNVALGLLDTERKRTGPDHIDLLEELITTKSWWDTVDMIASRLVGEHFTRYPEQVPLYTERWIGSGKMWLRRTAILYQLNYKQRTDKDRLFEYIRRNADDKEFFIRKAIGWALRQYSKTDEAAVLEFIASTPLQPLSVREGLKYSESRKQAIPREWD